MRFPACIALCLALSHTSAYTFAQTPAPTQPVITLQEAIQRGEHNEPNFATARGEAKATALDRSIARAALLPNTVYHNQFLYTQGTGETTPVVAGGSTTPAPIFIANNAVHEYVSQAAVTESIGLAGIANVHLADATASAQLTRQGLPRPNRKATTAMMRNTKNRIFAIPTAPAAIPPKPSTAAISAMTRNTTA